jgi:hypothetical protein
MISLQTKILNKNKNKIKISTLITTYKNLMIFLIKKIIVVSPILALLSKEKLLKKFYHPLMANFHNIKNVRICLDIHLGSSTLYEIYLYHIYIHCILQVYFFNLICCQKIFIFLFILTNSKTS